MLVNHMRLQYSFADISNFLQARALAAKADALIDQPKFREVTASHASEGYGSYKYFDKELWLRKKMMRAIELGLDKCEPLSVLDIGCGAGYFLYCCKYLGHDVHGIDLPHCEFYRDVTALFDIPRTEFKIEPYKALPTFGKRFNVLAAHQICFNGHKTEHVWGPNEWEFMLNDLQKNLLEPGGMIALEFNEEPEIGFFTQDVRRYFESRSARILRGRVFLAGEGAFFPLGAVPSPEMQADDIPPLEPATSRRSGLETI
ncbi:MAG: hypothetical protein KGR71_10140 [Proteobacteria bacterium]|nr:hypothetical protein [Pseudomonadota bacterium]